MAHFSAGRRTGVCHRLSAVMLGVLPLAVVLLVTPMTTAWPGANPAAAAVQGNVAVSAVPTASESRSGPGASALTDGRVRTTGNDLGAMWAVAADRIEPWAQLNWSSRQGLASVQIFGDDHSGARISSGRLTFSDGSALTVGAVLPARAFPTTVAFTARTVTWVRFTITAAEGRGALGVAEMRAYPRGALPSRFGTPAAASLARDPVNPACAPTQPHRPAAGRIYALCPLTNTRVSGRGIVSFTAPGLTQVAVSLWSGQTGGGSIEAGTVDVDTASQGRVSVAFSGVAAGPVTVALTGVAGPKKSASSVTYLQLYNASQPLGGSAVLPRSAAATGRTAVYVEEFNGPISYTAQGRSPNADYAASKPEHWGAGQFGEAIFPDPALNVDNLRIVDNRYLRIQVLPSPAGYRDPNGWDRTRTGGLLASARPGGSGFAAQHGYFEARILAPAAPGTWPAFWLLPTRNLIRAETLVAEIDAVELYGHDPVSACHTVHQYTNRADAAQVSCGRRWPNAREAARWHIYGVSVEKSAIVYYVDGVVVARHSQVTGGDQPMFFMTNLALGGGWPVQLDPVRNRAAMYVDYIRVYV